MKELPQIEIACSLDGAEAADRGDEIGRLASDALISRTRTDQSIAFVFAKSAEDRVRALAYAESQCCPFLSFAIDSGGDTISLEISGPREAEPVLEALFAAASK